MIECSARKFCFALFIFCFVPYSLHVLVRSFSDRRLCCVIIFDGVDHAHSSIFFLSIFLVCVVCEDVLVYLSFVIRICFSGFFVVFEQKKIVCVNLVF